MIARLLAAAIGQVEDVAELRERWEIRESVYSDELASSISRQVRPRTRRNEASVTAN